MPRKFLNGKPVSYTHLDVYKRQDLIRKHRLNKAKDLLKSGEVNVAEATWKVGFKDPSYFSKLYQEEFGETPSETRK